MIEKQRYKFAAILREQPTRFNRDRWAPDKGRLE